MASCFFVLAPLTLLSHCSCLYGGHVAVFDWLTLDFFCLTLQAMVFYYLYYLLHCIRFIVNFVMCSTCLSVYKVMSEITVCEFVYAEVHLYYDHMYILVQRMYSL